jgi:two-component system sensor histidine kinase BarA
VKRLIDAHGGKITIEDNQPKGTVFVVELPLGSSAGASIAPPSSTHEG